jgi:hypothetical protein
MLRGLRKRGKTGAPDGRLLVALACAALIVAVAIPVAMAAPVVDPSVPAKREGDPVVLTGQDFPGWSAPSNQTAKLPITDLANCQTFDEKCEHNHYAQPEVDTGDKLGAGTPTRQLLGYRYDAKHKRFAQIPFQVDEVFTRYLSNPASSFSVYSGEDQHTTYAYDREGFRYTKSDAANPCLARPDSPAAKDPVPGLDNNDELAFMASDAGPQAPAGAKLPKGIEGMREVKVSDPTNPSAEPSYAYVMKAGPKGPEPAFDASNGYVHYTRDANADTFEKSESSYEDYGNAATGVYCDAAGNVVLGKDGKPDVARRRPRDYAWVQTPRYRFRYDGRWLLTQVNVSPDGGQSYGPDLIDRWKARAFQQDRSSNTPCCGYEEEDTHWGGSSTLLGERTGPVRDIRETWGADSGTNVVRRESFYRDSMVQKTWLRVHVIPPLDGIYAQWDMNAGRMTTFYNPSQPDGVKIDGSNDEVFGNFDDPCNEKYDSNDTSDLDQGYRSAYRSAGICDASEYHQSVDFADPTTSAANAALAWNETAGPWGTIVDRITTQAKDMTAGGTPQALATEPYYRDDSCFDDATGSDPGPRVNLSGEDEPKNAADGTQRKCWHPSDGIPDGSDRYYQGDIGTHGLHLLFQLESDNARQQVPVDEIVTDWNMVFLPGDAGNVGEQYGRGFEKPLVATVSPSAG